MLSCAFVPAAACGETSAPAIVNVVAAMPSASLVLLIINPPHEVVILQKFALIQQT